MENNPLRVLVGRLTEVVLTKEELLNPLFRLGVEFGKRGVPHESVDLPFLIGSEVGAEMIAGRFAPLPGYETLGVKSWSGFARIIGRQGLAENEAELRKTFADTANEDTSSGLEGIKNWDSASEESGNYVIRLVNGNDYGVHYAIVGPFQSFESAGEWLDVNGFAQERPNLWTRSGSATLRCLGHEENILVSNLYAFVEYVTTPKELNFVVT